jgi:ABC-type multidrug transport system fused ATPase/permease subunit
MVYGCLFLIMGGYVQLVLNARMPAVDPVYGAAADPNSGAAYLTAMLLVLFSGSVLRRSLRIAGVWKPGRHSLQKVQEILDRAAAFSGQSRSLSTPDAGGIAPESDSSLPASSGPALPASAALVMEQVCVRNKQGQVLLLPDFATRAGRVSAVFVDPGQAEALLHLLTGQLKPGGGSVTLGKVPLADAPAFLLRKRVSFLSQQFPLVGESVFEAISYSRDKQAKSAAESMLRACQEDLPAEEQLNLHDRLNDNGQYLSETQRFRLQGARVLLTGKRLLLLDFPLDQVDASAAATFARMLKRYLVDRKAAAIVLQRSGQSSWNSFLENSASLPA